MRTMRRELDERLSRAAARSESEEANPPAPQGWKDLLKGLLAVHVARSAQRVLHAQAERPLAGRRGGAASSVIAPPTIVQAPVDGRARGEDGAAREARRGDRAGAAAEGAPQGVFAIAKRTWSEFTADNGTLMASSVAFWLVLSLIPLVAVAVAIFAYAMGEAQARQSVLEFTSQFLQGQRELVSNAIDGVYEARQTIGIVAIATLLFTASSGFATLETAINATWQTPNRSFLMNKVFAFGMMLLVGALFVTSLAITAAVQWAGDVSWLAWLEQSYALRAVGLLLPIAISGLMFTFIYKLYPNARVGWKPALIAGFVTAVLWEAFKLGYAWVNSGDNTATYGTLAGVAGLILWIYYSSMLVLLGSELTWVLAGCPRSEEKAAARPHPKA
ncbi:MAG: YihY/virulence factor BrkB family protein [Armatimonadota bacterium]